MLRQFALHSKQAVLRRTLATSNDRAALFDLVSKYPVGLSVHGFAIEDVQVVPEFSLVSVQLQHKKTGLKHLHLASSSDNNNVFSVAFKTNPPDSTGVPHVLEHTTLCGSYKYPVRDPFFKMLNRSLSNFMNAMTGHDYTYYPFATTNRKDFDNLMSVYLSSVFEPLLTYEDFLQEGWRLEQSDLGNIKSALEFKGVVYNEMKGQYSNSNYLYYILFQEAIYPSLKNSGGDPSKIIDMKYEDLIDFHSYNYHPSNAKTFTYGTFDLKEHLQKLDEFYGMFGRRSNDLEIKKCIFDEDHSLKRDLEVSGPVDTMSSKPVNEQLKASITWYLGNPLDSSKLYDIFKWRVLNTLLFDGHNAPLYQELIESGYAEDFAPNTGFDQTTGLMSFTVGLSNISREKADNLEAKIKDILKNKVLKELKKGEESLYHDRILAILHQLELGFKKHKPDFGLNLLNSLLPSWINGVDPVSLLRVQNILDRFKADYAEDRLEIFEELLTLSVLNEETPKFKFVLIPDENYNNDIKAKEAETLASRTEHLTDEDKEIIFNRGKILLEKQQKEEDVSTLPSLSMDDIPRQGEKYPVSFKTFEATGSKLQKRITNTNGLVYMTAQKDLSFVPEELYKYLPIFTSCLTNLAGTSKTSITELENKIQRRTGGISFNINAKANPYNLGEARLKFVMSGMSLAKDSAEVYDLWHEILTDTRFTVNDDVVDKLYTLIKNLSQNQLNNIADRGHSFANAYSNSQLTSTKYINNLLGGIGQVQLIMEISKKLEAGGKDYLRNDLLPILREIHELLSLGFTKGQLRGFNYSVISDKKNVLANEKLIETFDYNVAKSAVAKGNALEGAFSKFAVKPSKTILNFPFSVGYSSLAKLGAPYVSKDGAALQVLSQIVTFKHLHSVIRESNGAYGGGLNYDGLGGTLNFYSYRDPNSLKSTSSFLESFEFASKNLHDGKWDSKVLQEAKLSIFQSVDAPSHISSQGSALFLEDISDELKQERREMFLDISLLDLKDVNEKYLGNTSNDVLTVVGDASVLGADDSWSVKSFD